MQDLETPATGTDAAPTLADGRYRLVEELGVGGAATVYRALDTVTGRTCAVKVLRPDSEMDAQRERFAREGEVLTRLAHPNLVAVQAVGRDGERDYLVMEFVSGGSLRDRVERDGPLSSHQVRKVLDGLLAALSEVHGQSVVHRDVKPGNLLVDADGAVKLADFGIARVEGSLTRTGTTVGTYAFMAPEQLEDARAVGPAADLYGAAATAVALALGRPPFGLQDPERRTELLEPLDEDLAGILDRALQRDPDARWPSAQAMRQALRGDEPEPIAHGGRWAVLLAVALAVGGALALVGLDARAPGQAQPVAQRSLEAVPADEDTRRPIQPRVTAEPATAPTPVAAPPASVLPPVISRPRVTTTEPEPEPESEAPVSPEPPPPALHDVFIGSTPWSELWIDDVPMRRTPRTVQLAPGDHTVRLRSPDGVEKVHTLAVTPEGATPFCWDFDQEGPCPGR